MPISTTLYNRKTERQPIFDFMIKKDDFYINTHGVSVTENDKSFTNLNDGFFYVLNSNNVPIYFSEIAISRVSLRDERGYPPNSLTYDLTDTRIVDDYIFEDYTLKFRNRDIGKLSIRRSIKHVNGSNFFLNPFQSIEFAATYTVLNLNNLGLQYYGKSKINPNKRKGVIDVNFNIKFFGDKNLTKIITEPLTITINTIDTGFVPVSVQGLTFA